MTYDYHNGLIIIIVYNSHQNLVFEVKMMDFSHQISELWQLWPAAVRGASPNRPVRRRLKAASTVDLPYVIVVPRNTVSFIVTSINFVANQDLHHPNLHVRA